jgi:hypothetical protein
MGTFDQRYNDDQTSLKNNKTQQVAAYSENIDSYEAI